MMLARPHRRGIVIADLLLLAVIAVLGVLTIMKFFEYRVASTRDDLDLWVRSFKAPYTQVLDPGNANLGVFYDRAAIPWNCDLDARTMRILYSGTGAPESEASLLKDLDDRIKQIDATPAK